jgi:hypothetical protein
MKLLLDYSQIVISAAIEYNSQTKEPIDIGLLRHISLNNILTYKKKFGASTDDLIVCCDGRNYWRKAIFPHYKQNRKQDHDKSSFDWIGFFETFNQIKTELKTELPLKVLEVEGCEADDIIAVLSSLLCPHEDKIIIVSSDKDLLQLQSCPKVKQWSPYHKKFITSESSDYNLFEHIVRGDKGDGIPNILSDDDVFVTSSKRSKPLRATSVTSWMSEWGMSQPEKFCINEETLRRFHRNRILIDLNLIPDDVVKKIRQSFDVCQPPNVKTFEYLTKYKLRKILEKGML